MIKICECCGKEFKADKKTRKYCGKECSIKSRKSNKITVKCKHCSKEVQRYKSQCLTEVFCSRKCFRDYMRGNNSVSFDCEICGKSIRTSKSNYDKSNHHYCSYECARIGFSKYYNGANSPNYEGFRCICYYCNNEFETKKSYMNGHKNHFCSNECKNKWQSENIRGENHPNYNSNIPIEERVERRAYSEYWDWRNKVYERDGYTCQCCHDNKGGNLNAHHILNYSEHKDLRIDVNNGITLCNKCHKEFHNKYGNKKNNKEQLIEFIYMKNNTAS